MADEQPGFIQSLADIANVALPGMVGAYGAPNVPGGRSLGAIAGIGAGAEAEQALAAQKVKQQQAQAELDYKKQLGAHVEQETEALTSSNKRIDLIAKNADAYIAAHPEMSEQDKVMLRSDPEKWATETKQDASKDSLRKTIELTSRGGLKADQIPPGLDVSALHMILENQLKGAKYEEVDGGIFDPRLKGIKVIAENTPQGLRRPQLAPTDAATPAPTGKAPAKEAASPQLLTSPDVERQISFVTQAPASSIDRGQYIVGSSNLDGSPQKTVMLNNGHVEATEDAEQLARDMGMVLAAPAAKDVFTFRRYEPSTGHYQLVFQDKATGKTIRTEDVGPDKMTVEKQQALRFEKDALIQAKRVANSLKKIDPNDVIKMAYEGASYNDKFGIGTLRAMAGQVTGNIVGDVRGGDPKYMDLFENMGQLEAMLQRAYTGGRVAHQTYERLTGHLPKVGEPPAKTASKLHALLDPNGAMAEMIQIIEGEEKFYNQLPKEEQQKKISEQVGTDVSLTPEPASDPEKVSRMLRGGIKPEAASGGPSQGLKVGKYIVHEE